MAKKDKDIIVDTNLVTKAKSSGKVKILSRIPNGVVFTVDGEKHLINGTNQVTIDRDGANVYVYKSNRYATTYISQTVADYIIAFYPHLIEDKRIIIGDRMEELEAEAQDGLGIKTDTERANPLKSTDPVDTKTLKDLKEEV